MQAGFAAGTITCDAYIVSARAGALRRRNEFLNVVWHGLVIRPFRVAEEALALQQMCLDEAVY